ncbi:MAG: hypothetical protein AAF692_06285, partial [Pseudomonadota bacterium]
SSVKLSDLRSLDQDARDKAIGDLGRVPGAEKDGSQAGRDATPSERDDRQGSLVFREEQRGFGSEERDQGPTLDDDWDLGL